MIHMSAPKIQAVRALHVAKLAARTPKVHVPKVHVPSPHIGGTGLGGGAGSSLLGSGRVQGAPRMSLRIPSFIRKPTL